MSVSRYIAHVAEAISQLGNAVLLGGNPNMTVSARCYLYRHKPRWRTAYKWINAFFFWQDDHCRDSWVSDINFARKALFELEIPRMKTDPAPVRDPRCLRD